MGTQWGTLFPLVPTNMGEALSAEAFLPNTASWFTLEHLGFMTSTSTFFFWFLGERGREEEVK